MNVLDDQVSAILTQSVPTGTHLYSNISILPKLPHMDDSQVKQEPKLNISTSHR